jgi:predicted dehydrogenase
VTSPIGVAVIGTGSIAEAHLYAYSRANDRCRVVALADIVKDRARRAADRHGVADIATDYRDLLARDDVQAVSICTPPAAHVEISVAALEAGKHVLCEKPVAPTLAGLDEIETAEQASDALFSGVFQLRFGKGAQQLRLAIDEGRLGTIRLGVAETLWYRGPDYFGVPWRATWAEQCGGATVSQAIHLVDALIWCLGTPVSVYALGDSTRGVTECDETAVAVIRFESGAIGQVTSTVIAAGEERSRLEIYGEEVSAVSCGPVYEATAEAFKIGASTPGLAATIEADLEQKVPRGHRMLHRPQIDDFLHAIESGRLPAVGIAECRAALQVTAGIYKSAMTGQPVELPIKPGDPWYDCLPPEGFTLQR